MLLENPFDCFISSTAQSADTLKQPGQESALPKRDTTGVQASSLLKERAVKSRYEEDLDIQQKEEDSDEWGQETFNRK